MQTYRERLWPGPAGWLMVAGVEATAGLTASPFGTGAVVAAVGVVLVVTVSLIVVTSPVVAVVDGHLAAGRARIPVALLGAGEAIDRLGVAAALGPGSDARDFVVVRSWLPGAVSVPVEDPDDPTPRWLISTRRSDQLLAAITTAQAAHSEQIG